LVGNTRLGGLVVVTSLFMQPVNDVVSSSLLPRLS
jgi:hypothetical protein